MTRRFPDTLRSLQGTRCRKKLIIFVLLFSAHRLLSQTPDIHKPSRDNYIESFPDYFFVWPVFKITSTSFTVQHKKDRHQHIVYKPDGIVHAGGGVYVFGVGIQLVFALPQNEPNIARYGKSHAVDFQANVLGKNWVLDAFTQRYHGYYQNDSRAPVPAGRPYPQRPDIRTSNTGITGAWFLNKERFSIRSTYNYFERQLKSSGSFLISGNLNTFSLHADSSIYQSSDNTVFTAAADFHRVNYTQVALAPGYAYNAIIFQRFFISGGLAIGPAINWFYYETETVNSKRAVQLNTFVDFRFAIGYNGERVFSGITFNSQARNINYEGVRFTSQNEAVKFAVGYRFQRFGILKKNLLDIFKAKSE